MGQTTEHVAVYAGSFDPITLGHMDVLTRARRMFDRIVLGLGQNMDKKSLFSADERLAMIQSLVDDLLTTEPHGAHVTVERYDGLTVDFARDCKASVLLRGIRNITDLAYETQLAITNRQVADIETVFIVTGESYAYTSSSLIRQVAALGGSLDRLAGIVPPVVIEQLRVKQADLETLRQQFADNGHEQ